MVIAGSGERVQWRVVSHNAEAPDRHDVPEGPHGKVCHGGSGETRKGSFLAAEAVETQGKAVSQPRRQWKYLA